MMECRFIVEFARPNSGVEYTPALLRVAHFAMCESIESSFPCCVVKPQPGTSPQGIAEMQDHECKAGQQHNSCAPTKRVSTFQFVGIHGFTIGKHFSKQKARR